MLEIYAHQKEVCEKGYHDYAPFELFKGISGIYDECSGMSCISSMRNILSVCGVSFPLDHKTFTQEELVSIKDKMDSLRPRLHLYEEMVQNSFESLYQFIKVSADHEFMVSLG